MEDVEGIGPGQQDQDAATCQGMQPDPTIYALKKTAAACLGLVAGVAAVGAVAFYVPFASVLLAAAAVPLLCRLPGEWDRPLSMWGQFAATLLHAAWSAAFYILLSGHADAPSILDCNVLSFILGMVAAVMSFLVLKLAETVGLRAGPFPDTAARVQAVCMAAGAFAACSAVLVFVPYGAPLVAVGIAALFYCSTRFRLELQGLVGGTASLAADLVGLFLGYGTQDLSERRVRSAAHSIVLWAIPLSAVASAGTQVSQTTCWFTVNGENVCGMAEVAAHGVLWRNMHGLLVGYGLCTAVVAAVALASWCLKATFRHFWTECAAANASGLPPEA